MSNLNTNIHDYNVEDLLTILQLDDDFTIEELDNTIQKIINKKNQKTNIIVFFQESQGKLLNYRNAQKMLIEGFEDIKNEDTKESDEETENSDEETENSDEETENSDEETENSDEETENSDEETKKDTENIEKDTNKESNNTLEQGTNVLVNPEQVNIFPTETQSITQILNIDTRFRPNYYDTLSTSFTVDLPEIQRNVLSIRVASIEMPMTFYSVSSLLKNNTMLILGDTSNIDVSYVDTNFVPSQKAWLLTIPDGNYDTTWAGSLTTNVTHVNNAISYAIPGAIDSNYTFSHILDISDNHYINYDASVIDLEFSTDGITRKSVFIDVSNTNFITGFRFNIDQSGNIDDKTNIQLKLGWVLGFRNYEYNMITNTNPITGTETNTITSEGIPFLSGLRYCFLAINDFKNACLAHHILTYSDSIRSEDIICRINLAPSGLMLGGRDGGYTHNGSRVRKYQGPVDIRRLDISLHDEYGRNIDLNNMDWSFTLAFEKKFHDNKKIYI